MPILSTVAAATAKAYGLTANNPFANTALRLDFNETTTLDSRITFTRATDGTYFDSSGVLQTASSGAARFDHRLEGGVWVNKGLLIEEQRTNQLQRSEEFDNAYWTKSNLTVTANAVTAPDGTTTADSVLETTTNATHLLFSESYTASNTTISGSVFVKPNGRTRFDLQISNFFDSNAVVTINLTANTVTTSSAGSDYTNISGSITEVGDGFYRVTISATKGTVNTTNRLYVQFRNDSGQGSYAGDTSKGFYLWGAQLEAGAFPTSYIKTTTASATRNADQASMTSTNFSDWYNAAEGTMFTQSTIYYDLPSNTFSRVIEITDASPAERIIMNYASDLPGFRYIVTDNSSNVVSSNFSVGQSNGINRKFATAYKINDFAGSIDGGSVVTDTTGTLPTVSQINFGATYVPNSSLNGHIAKFYYWNTRKPDSFLQSITG